MSEPDDGNGWVLHWQPNPARTRTAKAPKARSRHFQTREAAEAEKARIAAQIRGVQTCITPATKGAK